uniref:Uncharacterized protein n=1 Tax=Coccidioides posadasii RMSCC 3488 TaxID=454284 RepID=A0A0J6F4C5_COCPO|nr:hypothetical protein CPAG_04099 [Coccidioides posadasii RMSCC 3488]
MITVGLHKCRCNVFPTTSSRMSGGQQQERPRLTTPSTASRARKNAARYSPSLSQLRGADFTSYSSYWPAIGEWLSTSRLQSPTQPANPQYIHLLFISAIASIQTALILPASANCPPRRCFLSAHFLSLPSLTAASIAKLSSEGG